MSVLFFSACILCVAYCGAYAVFGAACGQAAQAVSIGVLTALSAAAVAVLWVVA